MQLEHIRVFPDDVLKDPESLREIDLQGDHDFKVFEDVTSDVLYIMTEVAGLSTVYRVRSGAKESRP